MWSKKPMPVSMCDSPVPVRERERVYVGFRGFALDVCCARGHWYVPFLSWFGECAVDQMVFVSKAGAFDGGDVDVAVLSAIDAGVYGGFGD